MRTTLALVVGSAALFALVAACMPADDPTTSSSATVVEPPAKATYVAVCGFSLASYDPSLTFRFIVDATLSPSSLDLTLSPVVAWDEDAGAASPPATVSRQDIVGDPLRTSAPITSGHYEAALGDFEVPPSANGITGGPAHVDHLHLDGPAPAAVGDRFCGGFAGQLTKPLDFEFVRDENTCLFIAAHEGDPMPPVDASDFHCP